MFKDELKLEIQEQPEHSENKKNEESEEIFIQEELKYILKKLSKGKATGPDHIPNEVWRNTGIEIQSILLKLFNKCFAMGKIPKQ